MNTTPSPDTLTLVTVVFEPEFDLLRLQARSLTRYIDQALVARILVIDNTAAGLGDRAVRSLTAAYGPLAANLEIVRPGDLLGVPVSTSGWRTQQALKLLIADRIETDWYLVLDAKTVFTRATSSGDLFAPDGRPHGGVHSYAQHPLQPQLRAVIAYSGLDAEPLVAGFTSTATPFLLSTAAVNAVVADLASRHPQGFSAEFERAGLTEFFLYTASRLAGGATLHEIASGEPLESPTVWPRHRSGEQVRAVLDDAKASSVTTFAVHRTALARMDRHGALAVARFWVERELFPSTSAALRFIAVYRARYYPTMVARRLRAGLDRRSALGRAS